MAPPHAWTNVLARARRREAGQALPMVLGVMVALTASVILVMRVSGAGQDATNRTSSEQEALAVAEAGLSTAMSQLYAASNPSSPTAVTTGSEQVGSGTAAFSGTLTGTTWTLTGTGTIASPVAGAGAISRRASRRFTVTPDQSPAWAFNFSDSGSGCMSLKKDAVIAAPLYVRGDLCLGKDSIVIGGPLEVDGTLSLGNGATVGSSGSPVGEARLVGGCTGGSAHACGPSDGVYASSLLTTSSGLAKPAVDVEGWYAQAKPGPMYPCTTGSVPGGFDDDGTGPNVSRSAFSLMPGTGYSCQVADASGTVLGSLSWTPGSPGTLAVAGTIFFDGPLTIPANAYGVYSGRGTIYASGSISWGKDARLCGAAACDDTWNSNTDLLMLVAGDSGANAYTMEKNDTFQGMSYVVGDFSSKKDADHWGPIIANQLDFEKDAAFHAFPTTLPPGAPGAGGTITPVDGSWQNGG